MSTPKKVIADITIKEWTLSLYVMKSYIDFADNHEGEIINETRKITLLESSSRN